MNFTEAATTLAEINCGLHQIKSNQSNRIYWILAATRLD